MPKTLEWRNEYCPKNYTNIVQYSVIKTNNLFALILSHILRDCIYISICISKTIYIYRVYLAIYMPYAATQPDPTQVKPIKLATLHIRSGIHSHTDTPPAPYPCPVACPLVTLIALRPRPAPAAVCAFATRQANNRSFMNLFAG